MHRYKVWNTASPIWRTERNRVLSTDGISPAVDTLYFSPVDPIYDNTIAGVQNITPVFVLSYLESPVQFKYTAPRLPVGVVLYWKKNSGAFVSWPLNTLNGANFVTGDTLTVGISAAGAEVGDFGLTLFNSIDTAACSNTATILISGIELGAP